MPGELPRNRKEHWEAIYQNKRLQEVSWYQAIPESSLNFFKDHAISKEAPILDIGGGDSLLVDHLLEMGFKNITVLDISESAIQRAKNRLGEKAQQVEWIISDIVDFQPSQSYEVWHDRAAFHFLTLVEETNTYLKLVKNWIRPKGYLFISTFSVLGPKKCSGLEIKQYSENTLTQKFNEGFKIIDCFTHLHQTPFNTQQEFLYCSFQRK